MIYNKTMTEDGIEEAQQRICNKYNVGFNKPDHESMVGVADNLGATLPIHGLRHSTTDNTTGWYIWSGEYSEKKDFVKPMHMSHFIELHPGLVPYLGLPPGWRFLVDPEKNYEDVWNDDRLLLLDE